MKLRIMLDVWGVSNDNPGGIVNYKRQIARSAGRLGLIGDYSVIYAGDRNDKIWLDKYNFIDSEQFITFRIPGKIQNILPRLRFLPLDKVIKTPDIFHIFGNYSTKIYNTLLVGTLIDFVPMRVPEFVPITFTINQAEWCKWAGGQVDNKYIAISEKTKNDAIQLGRLRARQTEVVYPCVDDDLYPDIQTEEADKVLKAYNLTRPYVLYVSTLNLRKNHKRILDAWRLGAFQESGYLLVFVGHHAENPIVNQILQGYYGDTVRWLDYIPRKHLRYLYYGCDLFIYPSLYEGFGIPVAEALVMGKAVLTSKHSSMAEILADSGVYVDPWDNQDIVSGLRSLLEKPLFMKEIGLRNYSRRNLFSSAEQVNSLSRAYKAILEG